jgi:GWxTD domain-containing protein
MLNKIILLLIISSSFVFSQSKSKTELADPYYFDAIVFKGDSINLSRLDCYFMIPYQSLDFVNSGKLFGSNYTIDIKINDSTGKEIDSRKIEKKIREKDYYVTQGGTGAFDYFQERFYLKDGQYEISVILTDNITNKVSEKNRYITVINFSHYELSLSGLMLVSSIEEISGKYKITPHISDNIGNLSDGFFVFFEAYNIKKQSDSVDFVWEIYNSKDSKIAYSDRIRKSVKDDVNRIYLKIPKVEELSTGSYLLKIIALQPLNIKEYSDQSYIALAQRSLTYLRTVGGNLLADLNMAVRQLRYAANREDLDKIENAQTSAEKQKSFDTYWKNLDPSPGTERNEAFDEYYTRINYANLNFKSYQEGWMTDKGMIYVIYGDPYSIDKQSNYGDNRNYERWTYNNNREFIFVDNTGFGDYRLVRPITITEKYKYQR